MSAPPGFPAQPPVPPVQQFQAIRLGATGLGLLQGGIGFRVDLEAQAIIFELGVTVVPESYVIGGTQPIPVVVSELARVTFAEVAALAAAKVQAGEGVAS